MPKTTIFIFRQGVFSICLLLSYFVAPLVSASPTAEDTFRFIEKFQFQDTSETDWYNEVKWKFEPNGLLSISYYVKDPSEKHGVKDHYTHLIKMDWVKNLEIRGEQGCSADIPKCQALYPSLQINCKPDYECVTKKNWRSDEKSNVSRRKTISYRVRFKLYATADYKSDERKRIYKIKNAVTHLFKLKGYDIESDDNFFVRKDLFKGYD